MPGAYRACVCCLVKTGEVLRLGKLGIWVDNLEILCEISSSQWPGKVPPAYLPDPFPAPMNLYSGLDVVGVNLLQFCAVASKESDLLVLMLGRRISALPRADTQQRQRLSRTRSLCDGKRRCTECPVNT